MPPPLQPAKRQAILDDIRAGGKSQRQIARDNQVSTTVVRKIADQAGITGAWSREQTKKATEARQIDHKARLAGIAGRTAAVAEAVLDSFDDMSVEDWRKVSPYSRGLIVGIMADKARELSPDDSGADGVASLLGDLLGYMKAKHGDAPPE